MAFTCVLTCNATFVARSGLSRHQNTCQFFKTQNALKHEHRKIVQAKLQERANVKKLEAKQAEDTIIVRLTMSNIDVTLLTAYL